MTVDDLKSRLNNYLAAESAVLKAQEYVIGQGSTARRVTRANLAEIQKGITDTRGEIAQLESSTQRARRVIYLRPY